MSKIPTCCNKKRYNYEVNEENKCRELFGCKCPIGYLKDSKHPSGGSKHWGILHDKYFVMSFWNHLPDDIRHKYWVYTGYSDEVMLRYLYLTDKQSYMKLRFVNNLKK